MLLVIITLWGMIIAKRLQPLFGDNHAAAHRFYTELEQTAVPLPRAD
jgi:hypothetical protein